MRETARALTPFGGLSVFIAFLQKIGYGQQVREHMPVRLKSPNAIDPGETFTAFLMAVMAGARRFAHTALLRRDEAFHALLGIQRYPTDDTIRNLFKRFRQSLVVQFYEPLWAWQLARVDSATAMSLASFCGSSGKVSVIRSFFFPSNPPNNVHQSYPLRKPPDVSKGGDDFLSTIPVSLYIHVEQSTGTFRRCLEQYSTLNSPPSHGSSTSFGQERVGSVPLQFKPDDCQLRTFLQTGSSLSS